MPDPIRVLVWGENVHERKNAIVAGIYPDGMHDCIAEGLREDSAFDSSKPPRCRKQSTA